MNPTIRLYPVLMAGAKRNSDGSEINVYNPHNGTKSSIKIYNILGQEIKTLADGMKTSGYHLIRWDGTNNSGISVSSGVFLCKLKTNNFSDTKKLVLIK